MPFSAECAFCHWTLQSVPDDRLGHSVECPRCHHRFTLAISLPPVPGPGKVRRSANGRHHSKSDLIAAEKAPAGPSARPRPSPVGTQSDPDYFGVGSFGLGSYAFFVGALTHERFLTLGLGLAGLLCAVVGLCSSLSKQRVSPLASAGLIVSLPPVLVAVFLPNWLGLHLLTK